MKEKISSDEKILSIKISKLGKNEILQIIDKRIKIGLTTTIFTPNTQMILNAQGSPASIALLNSSTLNIPDGVGVVAASRILGGKIRKRIAGIELADALIALAESRGYKLFLLGSSSKNLKKAKKALKKRFPRLKICGSHHGYFKKFGKENEKLVREISSARPDILFVCLGSPLQEKWIANNSRKISSLSLSIGLGGSLDVWAGSVKRAPSFIQEAGLEWLYRAIREPRRAKIFIDIPIFLLKVLASAQKRK